MQELRLKTLDVLRKSVELRNLIKIDAIDWSTVQSNLLVNQIRDDMHQIGNLYSKENAEDFEDYFNSKSPTGLKGVKEEIDMTDLTIFTLNLFDGQSYPIHDHPKMIVFTLVLHGAVTIDYFKPKIIDSIYKENVLYQLDLVESV